MGIATSLFTDTEIKNLCIRAVFLGSVAMLLLIFASLVIKDKKHSSIIYLLMLGSILLVSTLLFSISLIHIQDTVSQGISL